MSKSLIDTYVIVSDDPNKGFCMAIYKGKNKAIKIASPDPKNTWKFIIPYNKFESDNIDKSLTYNLVNYEFKS